MKYRVEVYSYGDLDYTLYEGDNPYLAIDKWITNSGKYPMSVCITAGSIQDAQALIKTAYDSIDLIRSACEKNDCPYKWEYLESAIKRKYEDGCSGYYAPRDMVHPFDLG